MTDSPTGMQKAPPAANVHRTARRFARWGLMVLQLLLIATVVHSYQIENQRHLFPVLCFAFVGAAVQMWLPVAVRLRFFAALSAASVFFVLGVVSGMQLCAMAVLLMGICYLRLPHVREAELAVSPFAPRKGRGFRGAKDDIQLNVSRRSTLRLLPDLLLLLTATGLVYFRSKFPLPVWPVLGSMFMFRLVSYVHDTRRSAARPEVAWSAAYFFLLPNVCFPLFPVLDFQRFRDQWYNEDEWLIWQKGVKWMVNGVLHLLLYRWLSCCVVPEYSEPQDLPDLLLFMATNYALYLQVSGQFHLIAGVLHLFGWNLGRTHDNYFLATSCSDIWRRINIFWKDFMTKYFFYPAFFWLRGRGFSAGTGLVLSITWVFVCTWLLHSWQTFWILGRFPVSWMDACLWLGAGGCVAVNAVRRPAQRVPESGPVASEVVLARAFRIVCTFLTVSLFWACWTDPRFPGMAGRVLFQYATPEGTLKSLIWLTLSFLVLATGLSLSQQTARLRQQFMRTCPGLSTGWHLALLVVMAGCGFPLMHGLFSEDTARSLQAFRTNTAGGPDERRLQSYYEDLNSAAIQAGPLMAQFATDQERQREQAHGFARVSRRSDVYQEVELIPGVQTELEGAPFSVNEFGMRDRTAISQVSAPGVVRIALIGSSIVMGYGVGDDEVFGRRLESGLNAEFAGAGQRYEVLNFGVGRHLAPHRLVRIQRDVLRFDPDALYYFAHQDEFRELAGYTAQLISQKLDFPSPSLRRLVTDGRLGPEMAPGALYSRLLRQEPGLLEAVYETIVSECRSREILPVWIYLPVPGEAVDHSRERLVPIAERAGFVVADLTGWAERREGLFRTGDDHHPNAQGHQKIADAILRTIGEQPTLLPHQ